MSSSKLDRFYNTLWNIPEKYKKIIQKSGDVLQIIIPLSLLITLICLHYYHTAMIYAMAFAIAMLLQVLIKSLFNNSRPRDTTTTDNPDLNLDWSPNEGNSFCSGHTLAAMTGAFFWFFISPICGIIALIFAILVAFSRIVARAHWLRDVCTSTAISFLLFLIAVYL